MEEVQTIQNNDKIKNTNSSITLLHLLGMFLIIFAHVFQAQNMLFLKEVFSVGVPLFLFVSGYLTGIKPIKKTGEWYLRKVKRLLIPFWILILVVFVSYEITRSAEVSVFQWIFCGFNLQGLNYTFWKFQYYGAVAGCGHLWFTTTLMFCYLLTPLFQKINLRLNNWQKAIFVLVLLGVQAGVLYLGLQLGYFVIYFSGYFIARNKVRADGKYYAFLSILTAFMIAIRFLVRYFADATLIYDSYTVLVTSSTIAVWIFYTVFYFNDKFPKMFKIFKCGVVLFIEKISYYVYLTHLLFFSGPYSLISIFPSRILSYCVVFIASFASAIILWFVTEKLIFRLFERKAK